MLMETICIEFTRWPEQESECGMRGPPLSTGCWHCGVDP